MSSNRDTGRGAILKGGTAGKRRPASLQTNEARYKDRSGGNSDSTEFADLPSDRVSWRGTTIEAMESFGLS